MEREVIEVIEKHLTNKLNAKVVVSNLKLFYDVEVKSHELKTAKTTSKAKNAFSLTPAPKKSYRKKKFRRTGQFSLNREYTTSPEDVKVMRTFMNGWERDGLLTSSIKDEMNRTRGKFSVNFTREQKDNLLKMFNQMREVVQYKSNGSGFQRKEEPQESRGLFG